MADDPDRRETVRPLRRDFSLTITAAHRRAAGNPTALKALAGIERRAAAAKERARDLHHAFQDRWTAKETVRLWKRYLERSGQLDAPTGAKRTVDEKELAKIASQRVEARTNRRLAKIEGIKTRMANAVVRSLGTPSLSATFEEASPVISSNRNDIGRPKQRRRQ